jgi:hypothetical protein
MAKFHFDEEEDPMPYQPKKNPGKKDMWAQNPRKKTKIKKFKYKNL